jgi:hypothetical protein
MTVEEIDTKVVVIKELNTTIKEFLKDFILKIATLSIDKAVLINLNDRNVDKITDIFLPQDFFNHFKMEKLRKYFYFYYKITIHKDCYQNSIRFNFEKEKGDK